MATKMRALFFAFTNCFVTAVLYMIVDEFETPSRFATLLKFL